MAADRGSGVLTRRGERFRVNNGSKVMRNMGGTRVGQKAEGEIMRTSCWGKTGEGIQWEMIGDRRISEEPEAAGGKDS